MTGQKPGRTLRSFAKRIGEGVQSSTVMHGQLREKSLPVRRDFRFKTYCQKLEACLRKCLSEKR